MIIGKYKIYKSTINLHHNKNGQKKKKRSSRLVELLHSIPKGSVIKVIELHDSYEIGFII